MKKTVFLMFILCGTIRAPAQTLKEWLRQKETQQKYLLEQISALKTYLGYAKKGYEIVGTGWRTIQGIKEGDLNLHSTYFSSLSHVNPLIKASPFVGGIIILQGRTKESIQETEHLVKNIRQLTPSEISYAQKVLDGLIQKARYTLEELRQLTISDGLKLSDDERLHRIEVLYKNMQETYSATSSFCSQLKLMAVQRIRQQVQIDHSKQANGLR